MGESALEIGILGTGRVAQALSSQWLKRAHRLTFGSRNPSTRQQELGQLLALDNQPLDARFTSIEQCVAESAVLVVALPWQVALDSLLGLDDGRRRTVIDCINPLRPDLKGKVIEESTSTLTLLQDRFPTSDFVKAFNGASSAVMADPSFDPKASMPLCGDSAEARKVVMQLVADAGFEPIDCGDSIAASWLESLTLLTIRMAIQNRWKGDVAVRWDRRD